jgi:hypothetical protein
MDKNRDGRRNATECHKGLREVCGNRALPYRTVTRWVTAFRQDRDKLEDAARSYRHPRSSHQVDSIIDRDGSTMNSERISRKGRNMPQNNFARVERRA